MLSEFEFLKNLKSKYVLNKVGDDCAVLPKDADTDLLLTADMLVEDIDFRLDWTTPEFLGHKALAVSLSDIAAMGGTPVWSMLSIGIPADLWKTDFLDRFYEGWFALAKQFDVELVGGDVSKTPDKIVIDSIVGGEVPKDKAIVRSGAKPGEAIYVTGALGGAAGGLSLLESGTRYDGSLAIAAHDLMIRQLQPTPQLATAKLLQIHSIATAMIDLSDGLSSDLMHLCSSSGVGAHIYSASLPINPFLFTNFHADESLEMALHGGEDFGLLFTADEKKVSALNINGIIRIGIVTSNVGITELTSGDITTILEPKGYRHF